MPVTFLGSLTMNQSTGGASGVEVDQSVDVTQLGLPALVGGRYRLGPLLGRGGGAEVFRAHDQVLDRAVAVKIFPAGLAGPESSRQRREVSTLAGLSHPGLVMVYDAGNDEGRAFFVMQLVEGRTLADRLWEGPLPAAEAVACGIALADALAYVHGHGIVHRDVKPGNVLLDRYDRPHLSDFGIAALVDSTQITGTGTIVGTAAYLAPDQVRGRPVRPSVDVYALGLVLLECLTGEREYPGPAMEAALARLHRPPDIPEGLPRPMSFLLHAMTADDPDERPSAAEVGQRLRAITPFSVASRKGSATRRPYPSVATMPTPVAAEPGWSLLRSGITGHRHRSAILLVAALLVAITLGSVLAIPGLTNSRTTNAAPTEASLPSTPPASSTQDASAPAPVVGQFAASPVDESPGASAPLIPAGPPIVFNAVPRAGPAKDHKSGRH